DDLVLHHQTGTSASRTHVNFHVTVLSATAGLLDQFPDAVRAACDCLTIRDLRFARVRVHFELTEHTIANDFQMQLAHSGDDGLSAIFVGVSAKRRMFLCAWLRRQPASVLTLFCLWP